MQEMLGLHHRHRFKHHSVVACYSVAMGYQECTQVCSEGMQSNTLRPPSKDPESPLTPIFTSHMGAREPCGEQLNLKHWICETKGRISLA